MKTQQKRNLFSELKEGFAELKTSREAVLNKTREYFDGTTAQPQVARQFEVASEQSDDLEEVGFYLFGVQKNNK